MRPWLLVLLGWLALLATAWALARLLPEAAAAGLYGAFILASGLGASAFAAHRRRRTRADAPDGVEHDRAAAAAGVSFQAALILMVTMGAWLVVRGDYAAAAVTYGAVVALIAVFWTSYALLRRRF